MLLEDDFAKAWKVKDDSKDHCEHHHGAYITEQPLTKQSSEMMTCRLSHKIMPYPTNLQQNKAKATQFKLRGAPLIWLLLSNSSAVATVHVKCINTMAFICHPSLTHIILVV